MNKQNKLDQRRVNIMLKDNQLRKEERSDLGKVVEHVYQKQTNCYCVCHSPYSSRAYCEHCKGNNEVGDYCKRCKS